MASNNNLGDYLTAVADAIRYKRGETGKILAQEFPDKISSIQLNYFIQWLADVNRLSENDWGLFKGTTVTDEVLLRSLFGVDFSKQQNYQHLCEDCEYLVNVKLPSTFHCADGSSFYCSFRNCIHLETFDATGMKNAIGFMNTWEGDTGLVTFDCSPLVNSASSANFSYAWRGCTGLKEFNATGMYVDNCVESWSGCSSLTSFDTSEMRLKPHTACPGFSGCTNLVKFNASTMNEYFSLKDSNKFTEQGLVDMFNTLQTVSSGGCEIGATNLAKLTDEEKKIATDKGWQLF